MHKLKTYYRLLIGDEINFVLENRLTNAVFLITAVLMSFSMILSLLFLGITDAIPLYAIAIAAESIFYYFSRFRKAYKPTIIISTIMAYAMLALNYYNSSGLDGPSIFSFLLVFQLVITILPRAQHWIWIIVNIGILYSLLYIDYHTPGLIKYAYNNASARFIDLGLNYGISILFMYFITISLRNGYKKEKALAEIRAASITTQNGKLEQLLLEKDKLFSIITHDLRSPLNSIQGYLELLQEHTLTAGEKAQTESELLDFTKETSDMLFNTLAWAKSQMKGFAVNIQPINIDEIINQTLKIQKSIASKKNIDIRYSSNAPLLASGDKELFQVVIRNLVGNAIKFTPPHGEIAIEVQSLDNECLVSVSDNGIGIPIEKQADVFILKSASTVGTQNEKGIGLGLTICKEFLELQHGRIWIDNMVKKGSTFRIALPLLRLN
jgi:signal transduction histidine kinase